jgi:hypothetical protein
VGDEDAKQTPVEDSLPFFYLKKEAVLVSEA